MGKKKYKNYIEYICELCNVNFGNKKDNYIRHKNRIRPCVKNAEQNNSIAHSAHTKAQNAHIEKNKLEQNIMEEPTQTISFKNTKEFNDKEVELICIEINKVFSCDFCDKEFNKKFNLNRHMSTCKKKDTIIETNKNSNKIQTNNDDIDTIKKELIELKENYKTIKKDNEILKKKLIKKDKENNKTNTNINIVNNIVNNNNNIANFYNVDYSGVDKKLFVQPIMNPLLYGKAIILQMIENIYINENLPKYQNIIITDKNRGYVKIFNNGRWKTDDIQVINSVLDGIISHSKTILEELTEIYFNNNQAKSRLNTSKKYIDLCDLEYLGDLEDEHANGDANNSAKIKRCKDFREMVYKDTINLFHDNKNILIKPKNKKLIELK